ncbi:MAG: hypothetical protein U0703_11790 [Anaerolineae bacterium]
MFTQRVEVGAKPLLHEVEIAVDVFVLSLSRRVIHDRDQLHLLALQQVFQDGSRTRIGNFKARVYEDFDKHLFVQSVDRLDHLDCAFLRTHVVLSPGERDRGVGSCDTRPSVALIQFD